MGNKLAKQLKDAGYSFTECHIENCPYVGDSLDESGRNYHHPTLSELIDACGDKIFSLQREEDDDGYIGWLAGDGTTTSVKGSTPEEAVANLYIALYNKSNETRTNKNK